MTKCVEDVLTDLAGCCISYLQVGSHKRLAACVVKVTLHQKVQKVGRIIADEAQLGVATLEDFIAERGAHVGPTVEKRAGELKDTEGSED